MCEKGKTIPVYVSAEAAKKIEVASKLANLRVSPWGARAFDEQLKREGFNIESLNQGERLVEEFQSLCDVATECDVPYEEFQAAMSELKNKFATREVA